MKIIEVDEELYQYIAAQTQSIGESASDILRRLLNLPTHATSSVDTFESVASAETSKSAVHSEPVLTEKTTEATQPKVEPAEPPKTVKKQSDEAINHIVDKVRALLNSAEFKEEPKAVVRFLSILRTLYRTNPESFAQATESLQGRTRVYFARDEGTLFRAYRGGDGKRVHGSP